MERNCGRYEWMALDWNENALEVYRRMGAREMSEWVLLRMNRAQLQQMGANGLMAAAQDGCRYGARVKIRLDALLVLNRLTSRRCLAKSPD